MREYVIGEIPSIAAHWEEMMRRSNFLDCSSTENDLKIDLTKEIKVVSWRQDDELRYEFALKEDITLLLEYLFEYNIPYCLKIGITEDNWRKLFNEQVNELLQRKKAAELRNIIKFVEISNS